MPTVNCRLSFRIVGQSNFPTRSLYRNMLTNNHGYVLARQRRNLSDVLFAGIVERLLGVSGKFDFVIAARVRRGDPSKDSRLIGKLYLVRSIGFDQRTIANSLDNAFSKLEAYQNSPNEDLEVRKTYCEQLEILPDHADIQASFVLQRNGMLSISRIKWRIPEQQGNSASFSKEKNVDLDHIIADQFYFFIRDISHQHQHHGPDADTIITTYGSNSSNLSWCRSILYALYYHVIDVKRRKSSEEQIRILGVLAYIQAFKHIVEERAKLIGFDPKIEIPYFDDGATKDSIIASRTYLDALANKKRLKNDNLRTWILWIAAAVLTVFNFVSGFADEKVSAHWLVRDTANVIKEQAWVCIVPLLAVLVWWGGSEAYLRINQRSEVLKDIVRVAFINRTVAIFILLGFFSLFSYLVYDRILAMIPYFFP